MYVNKVAVAHIQNIHPMDKYKVDPQRRETSIITAPAPQLCQIATTPDNFYSGTAYNIISLRSLKEFTYN